MMREILTNKVILYTLVASLIVIIITVIVCLLLHKNPKLKRRRRYKPGSRNLKVDIGNAQIIGTREKQDDAFATHTRDYGVMAVVADGIGGYINGNIASSITIETYMDEFAKRDVTANTSYFFQTSALLSNERIRDEFGEAKGGTTVVAIVIEKNNLNWSSVGDSNIAIYRDGRLITVNRKENMKNWLEDQYFAGAIAREDAIGNPYAKRLVNYIGFDGFKRADESEHPIVLQKKDKVLLYSDGIEVLSQIELEKLLSKRISAQKTAELMIRAVENKKVRNQDNATIIILRMK